MGTGAFNMAKPGLRVERSINAIELLRVLAPRGTKTFEVFVRLKECVQLRFLSLRVPSINLARNPLYFSKPGAECTEYA